MVKEFINHRENFFEVIVHAFSIIWVAKIK